MSARLNNNTDLLSATFGSSLSIGTGDYSMGVWALISSDFAAGTNEKIIALTGASGRVSIQLGAVDAGTMVGEYSATNTTSGYTYTTTTWYWGVLSRSGSTARFRVFSDSTSTTPLFNTTATDSSNYTDFVTAKLGFFAGVVEGPPAYVQNFKIQTGVAWTDAECRTEALYYGIQKSGGTDRLCWRLKDIDADTDGLNEIGGAGPNFTNSGAIADAGAPTNLSEAGGGSIGFDDGDGPVSMTIQRAGPMIRMF